MTEDLFAAPDGATPLDADDAAGLIPTWIGTRDELNQAEGDNVTAARTWAFVQHTPWTPEELLDEPMMRAIHERMFGQVWKWAGDYRTREVNIGVPWHQITGQVEALMGDVRYQVSAIDELPWTPDEVAVRFHHRLVSIHPFPNGNGRHARLCADMLVSALGRPELSWGGADLGAEGELRDEYLQALRIADDTNDYGPLVDFARS
jgi:Fic-DOC domain mobile mystery protein B